MSNSCFGDVLPISEATEFRETCYQSGLYQRYENGEPQSMYYMADSPGFMEWQDRGGVAVQAAKPEPLPAEQRVEQMLADYGLTREELRAALVSDTISTSAKQCAS